MTSAYIKIDGSFDEQHNVAGIGYTITLPDGTHHRGGDLIPETPDRQTFEIEAAIRAVTVALDHGADAVTITTDCRLVTNYARGNHTEGNSVQQNRGNDLYSLLETNLEEYTVNHVSRTQNKQADELAHKALRHYKYHSEHGVQAGTTTVGTASD